MTNETNQDPLYRNLNEIYQEREKLFQQREQDYLKQKNALNKLLESMKQEKETLNQKEQELNIYTGCMEGISRFWNLCGGITRISFYFSESFTYWEELRK